MLKSSLLHVDLGTQSCFGVENISASPSHEALFGQSGAKSHAMIWGWGSAGAAVHALLLPGTEPLDASVCVQLPEPQCTLLGENSSEISR